MQEIGVSTLAVLSAATRGAHRQTQNQRYANLAVAHVVHFRGLIDYLVHRAEDKVPVLHLGDRPHSHHRGANCRPDDGRL